VDEARDHHPRHGREHLAQRLGADAACGRRLLEHGLVHHRRGEQTHQRGRVAAGVALEPEGEGRQQRLHGAAGLLRAEAEGLAQALCGLRSGSLGEEHLERVEHGRPSSERARRRSAEDGKRPPR